MEPALRERMTEDDSALQGLRGRDRETSWKWTTIGMREKGDEQLRADAETVIDILASTQGQARAIGYFRYGWTLKDGTKVYFDAADVFDFNAEDEIVKMTILYDTHPLRELVGNKYG